MGEYKLNKLDDVKFGHLKNIIRYSKEAESVHRQFLSYNTHGIVGHDDNGVGPATLIPLSIKLNKPLTDFFQQEFNVKKDSIVSIHINEYEEGVECLPHKDTNSEDTILILLNSCDEGGDLILENKSIGFNEEGQYVSYNGGDITHSVTKVQKGFRRSLVIWLRPKTSLI